MLLLLFLAFLPWPELPVQRWIKVGRITIFVLFMISSRYMRLHIYHCLRPAELGFLQALMLPAKSTIIKGKIGPRRLGHIQLESSVITDKIISLVTSNCRSVGFHLENTASLLLRTLLFSVMLRTRVWRPDLCLMENLEPGCIAPWIKKVLLLPRSSKTGSLVSQEEGWSVLSSLMPIIQRGRDPGAR